MKHVHTDLWELTKQLNNQLESVSTATIIWDVTQRFSPIRVTTEITTAKMPTNQTACYKMFHRHRRYRSIVFVGKNIHHSPSSPFMRSVAFKEAFLNLSLFFIRFLFTLKVRRAPNISGSFSWDGDVSCKRESETSVFFLVSQTTIYFSWVTFLLGLSWEIILPVPSRPPSPLLHCSFLPLYVKLRKESFRDPNNFWKFCVFLL